MCTCRTLCHNQFKLTHYSLVDRDMFMRFRGGGTGHGYMRHIESWLDGTGWGTTWPSLSHMEPSPQPGTDDGHDQMNIVAHQRRGDGDKDSGIGDIAGCESDGDRESEDGDGD